MCQFRADHGVQKIRRRILSKGRMSFTELEFAVENDEKESQCPYYRETVEVPGGTNGQIHLSGIPTYQDLEKESVTLGVRGSDRR
jgi:hypothetical protein